MNIGPFTSAKMIGYLILDSTERAGPRRSRKKSNLSSWLWLITICIILALAGRAMT